MKVGKVILSAKSLYRVKSGGHIYDCTLRGRLRLSNLQLTNPIVVGDKVSFQGDETNCSGVIHEVIPRTNVIMRQATHKKTHGQLLAANLDQALMIATAVNIENQFDFIDWFLVVAESCEITPIIVFNKLDLLPEEEQPALKHARTLYESLGYKTFAISAYLGTNIEPLHKILTGKTSLLSGHSGAGKSTLLNTLFPQANQAVGAVSAKNQKGRHTTTHSSLLEIAQDTFVIDAPGIQTLVPYSMEKRTLSYYFPEIKQRTPHCKFHNCTHIHEPHCAVLGALKRHEIAASRYKSYKTLFHNTA